MAILNKTQLKSLSLSNLPDNTSNLITPAKLRDVEDSIVDSFVNLITNQSQLYLNNLDPSLSYSLGACAVIEGDIYQCLVSNSTIGSYVPEEWQIISTFI